MSKRIEERSNKKNGKKIIERIKRKRKKIGINKNE